MFDRLAEYDGKVIAERTKGELAARCAGTSMTFVAIDRAHDIVAGKRPAAEARAEHSRLYEACQNGEKLPYMQPFQLDLPRDTRDPDASTIQA